MKKINLLYKIVNNNINNQSELYTIAEKIGKYLYKQKIIGYVTIELIVFKTNYNCLISHYKNNVNKRKQRKAFPILE